LTDGAPKLYACEHKEVPSAAARLDQFFSRNAVASDERVTVISDDAGEFEKAVQGSQLARRRILDWFHIAMKFKTAQRSVFGSKMLASLERGVNGSRNPQLNGGECFLRTVLEQCVGEKSRSFTRERSRLGISRDEIATAPNDAGKRYS